MTDKSEQGETVPLAAVSLSQRHLSTIKRLYPHFPLDNEYNLVLIDPPWKYDGIKNKPPYPCLTQQELKQLPIKQITKRDAILLLWTTGPMQEKAISLIKHWGFSLQTTQFVWDKVKHNKQQSVPGTYSNPSQEFLLLATKGQVAKYLTPTVVEQKIAAPKLRHSQKPQAIMDAIARKFDLQRMTCLEIFARERMLPQFDLYGDELTPRFQPAVKTFKPKVNLMTTDVIVPPYRLQKNKGLYPLGKEPTSKKAHSSQLNNIQLNEDQKQERVNTIMQIFAKQTNTDISKEVQGQLRSLIEKFVYLFAFNKNEFGLTDVLQHHINLEKDVRPIARAPYKVAPSEEQYIEGEVQQLKLLKCIEDSTSEWASPIVLVKKANGDLRFCIDFRGLNKVTVRDQYPLPRIDQILIKVCKGRYFTKLDLKSGFWQVSVYYEDRHKTSFVCSSGTYQWRRMPFGLTNAPATFQRLMNKVLRDYINKFCIVYIDDIVIFSDTPQEHLKHIHLVFAALEAASLKLGYDKCEFFQNNINMLGHTISHGHYRPLESRIKAITELARPKDVKGIQTFMGLVTYHGQFIPKLSQIAKPLRELTKKNITFSWGVPQENAFNTLKAAIATNPILHIPLPGKLMVLYTDFSETGIGAVLAQQIQDNEERVIEYASRTLKKHEGNYPAYKGEVLAVSWAIAKFRQYLLQAPFRLVLDNMAAVKLLEQYRSPENLNNLQKTVLNWVLELQDYHFVPVHRAGTSHNNADALSRLQRTQIANQASAKMISSFTQVPPSFDEISQVNSLNWWGEKDEIRCIKCHQLETDINDLIICDCCGKFIHQLCHTPKVQLIPLGPWYCNECHQWASQLDVKDPTLDFPMIEYIKSNKVPSEYEEQDILSLKERSSQYYLVLDRLRCKNTDKIVPTITKRKVLLNQIHDTKGHGSWSQLLNTVDASYTWPTMIKDIKRFTSLCTFCSQMNPTFIANPILHPTEKGNRPFAVVHVDLTGDLQTKVTSDKNRYLFILVDAFSKWVEVYPIPNGKSNTTAKCFWDVVKRFGSPNTVITDKGTEFKGEFASLLSDLRVQFITISPRNPQANGMAERTVKTVKAILKRFVNSPTQNVEWDEAAQAVQLSINTSNSQSTRYSPYEILFGRKMEYPSSVVVDPPIHPYNEPSRDEIDSYVRSLKESFKTLHPKVFVNIQQADQRNKRLYDKRHNRSQIELKFGDFVMVKTPKVTKLGKPAKGPFQFLRYLTKERMSAELVDPTRLEKLKKDGKMYFTAKTFRENTSNLALVKVDREQFDFTEEEMATLMINQIGYNIGDLQKSSYLYQQTNNGLIYTTLPEVLSISPLKALKQFKNASFTR